MESRFNRVGRWNSYDRRKNKKSRAFIKKPSKVFFLTYGDGVSNIDILKELEFHKKHGKIATMGAVFPPARWGSISINKDNMITDFIEKPRGDNAYINGGFFILNGQDI
ncbi:sugar phosphate nucleotidyltransferase [Brachyspira hyodysenteriae]|uniref:sugar phosphate nucleotidyltransferase n=1 Tax=Brachyspira hyodysenteriae TaxID=159 RepID=UPI0022CE07E7|nr:sugar phosphate nucleotidyltransferase [Brachyspira hyodysenteriae]MDA0027773.1 sugar phosphate nucleotidyltransferase [Brachyspira hyodysenteriae]